MVLGKSPQLIPVDNFPPISLNDKYFLQNNEENVRFQITGLPLISFPALGKLHVPKNGTKWK